MSALFHPNLLEKYNISGPRYTSYPTALEFSERFSLTDYTQQAHNNHSPLSLYFHIPFCSTVCFFCACNKIITNNRKRAQPYLDHLHREIELQAQLFSAPKQVNQLHLGGGTPTFISMEQMAELLDQARQHFQFVPDDQGEYSIEIDPREATAETILQLRQLGFNRLSLGVQDVDARVQQAINRIQPVAKTAEIIEAARAAGFRSISIDLIYGLPYQSGEHFEKTLEQVLCWRPDRLSVFNYAHLPHLFKSQKQMDETTMPSSAEKLVLLKLVIERLTAAGYLYIGMDHFALPEDELAQAQRNGTLYRNFQGYSTFADCDLIGMGLTAIGKVGRCYVQNYKEMADYVQRLEQPQLPLARGILLTDDDLLRREIITELMCHFRLDFTTISTKYQIDFVEYFQNELHQLRQMQTDGLLQLDYSELIVAEAGRLLIRNIAMVFDRYLQQKQAHCFSKVI